MIKATQLVGRAVIDMEAAQRLGRIKEIIVQQDGQRVAGFVVVHGETIVGTGGTRRIIPSSALHSIGPDAITVRGSAVKERSHDLSTLPRMSDVIGHKMVTRSGRLLGSIDDVLINGTDGTIVGYVVGEGVRNKLENILNPQRSRVHGYVRADADLKVGDKLIVVPDDALIEEEPRAKDADRKTEPQKITESHGWGDRAAASESERSSIWMRGSDTSPPDAPQTPTEGRFESETARPVENEQVGATHQEPTPENSGSPREDEPATVTPRDQTLH
jgi:uncharacterized protein YrrD